MILLDTNILSALMLREPDPAAVSWLDRQSVESVWTTAITVFEIRFGLEGLAGGRRRHRLEEMFNQALEEDLEGRVLPFDPAAARASASIAAQQRKSGRPFEIRDVQIAGIALTRKAVLATRNTRHFQGLGIHLTDPWKT
jgi:predicted nucleic acid-binding protein